MGYSVLCQKLCQMENRRLVMVMSILATVVLVFQSFMLPYGNAFSSIFPAVKVTTLVKRSYTSENSSHRSTRISELPQSSNSINSTDSAVLGVLKITEVSNTGVETSQDNKIREKERDLSDDFALDKDGDTNYDFELDVDGDPDVEFSVEELVDAGNDLEVEKVIHSDNDSMVEITREMQNGLSPEKVRKPGDGFMSDIIIKSDSTLALGKVRSPDNDLTSPPVTLSTIVPDTERNVLGKLDVTYSDSAVSVASNVSSTSKQATGMLSIVENSGPLQGGLATLKDISKISSIRIVKQGKPPITISVMNSILQQSRVSSRSMRTQWSSARDKELLSSMTQIENAPIVKNDHELYGPVFRNVSMFKRSYELMERKLKVYVYKEGEKPIFHKSLLRGIYASEGWFMKLMEGNKQFVVNRPRKAHLFYLPFSARILRTTLYKPELRSRSNLVEYLKEYVDKIAAKYPFWNKTGGADHFLVACHDWAPYETRNHMKHSIRALCNADASKDFKLGKDVSLPVTNVRSGQNPLRDLGGKPASKRTTLAFYAGNMHGRLRPILLQYWENKDPDMKILGPMPHGVDSKMIYIEHMKNSKYCICPRGYEVHTPRVVEAIFYECVPVILSDNYVPPFFEVLDWEAFAVFVAEKDIPILKDILLSIPEERYLTMQMRVKKVQQHFLWHKKPVKYDIFHMILHSIWLNRLHQIRIG
ncbi:probable glycosyltransferase At3g07620 [Magnolia sinica]|uniref:probable glycosyltransferase At3g07620 n=1 Tax=Magnolia sinica TaxID=86752 RepID=UPI00265971B4|nr:probable glycosyltransferase At3g07620 [Magnolia sinica]XP_058114563.1 probable glycosyltransferase At3g07620 [Magnolia sinica]XP_058114569.1 probable glycosyltransferase At3g07620 [Magnolia sinica]